MHSTQSTGNGSTTSDPFRIGGGEPDEDDEVTHYVLGGGQLGVAIARRLRAAGHEVAIVDESYEPGEIPGVAGDPKTVDALAESGVGAASTVIVATGADRRTLLVAQLVRTRFDDPRVLAVVRDPERLGLFAEAGHETLCATTAISDAIGEAV